MQVEAYFQAIQATIEDFPEIRLSEITFEKRGVYEGFIRGELTFLDSSVLHFREYVDTEGVVERLMYVYHFMGVEKNLVFRYDNSGHHKSLNLPSHPHHKHDASANRITVSAAPDLRLVLREIVEKVGLS